MSTGSSARNLFPPLDNPELTIRRRSRADPTLLNDFEIAAEGNDDPPVPDLRTIEELCQPSLNGRGGPIAPITIQATNFGLKNDMIQQLNEITNFCQRLDESLFEAWERYKLSIDRCPNHNMLPVTQIDTFYNGLTLRHHDTINAAAGGTFMKRRPEECYDLIENMTAYHNDWDTSTQWSESYSYITSSSDLEIAALKAEMAKINKNLMRVLQVNQQVKAVTPNLKLMVVLIPTMIVQPPLAKPKTYILREPTKVANDAILKNMQTNMTSLTICNLELKNMFGQFMKMNITSSSGSGILPSNTITNPKEDLKGITTRSGTAYQGPMIPTTSFSLPKVVERETEVTKDTMPPTNNGSTKDVQPLVVQIETLMPNYEPVVAPINEPVVAPVSALKPNLKRSISYPSTLHDQKLSDKTNDQKDKFFKIFQDLNFNSSFIDALILMPKFGPSVKSLLTNKDKLFKLARTSLNEHCSAVLLKKLPEKLGDPDKFLIPCDFPRMAECLALADLGASINLMPLSVWNKLSLPKLTPTLMTLELVDRSISQPIGVAEDVYVKVGKFHFSADFVEYSQEVLGFFNVIASGNPTPYYDLIISTSSPNLTPFGDSDFLLEEVIDMAYEEYPQEVLGFFNVIASGNLTPYYDLIISTSSPTLTPFGDSDFLLEEVNAFFALEDDATSSEVDQSYYDPKGDILLLEAFQNDDPSLPPPTQGNNLPQVRKELKIYEAKNDKSSIPEPPEVELKDLPPHLEYAFLEGDDKLPVIIAKDLSEEEKTALIKVLKSHKQAIAWKLSDIKSIDWEFCNHKILMEDDFEPVEKSHFIIKEGIVLGHKISKNEIEVDKAKVDVIAQLPHPITVKGAVLGQHQEKHFRHIHYASKTMTEAESNYTTTEKEMLAVVYAFEKFRSYLIMNKSIVYTDHSTLKYLFTKKDSKARLLRWVLLLPNFTFKVIDIKEAENLAADHLSLLENPHQNVLDPKEINETFPLETLNMVSFHGNSSTSWFADFANYHAGNFIVKGMSSQQKNKLFKDVKHYF
uniref:Reverse transcriptase domain-containing protein n=1 Tax=Tanacetum cinerariifolium TaxID=118510 RepID=A0A6L2JWL4_TANCI|nr:reverse transcriptase domain-containing protein [Tanacetum cinerariifolium]